MENSRSYDLWVMLTDPQPPSVNRLYRRGIHGKQILSAEGGHFKSALTQAVVQETLHPQWLGAVDAIYRYGAGAKLIISLYGIFINASWVPGAKTPIGELQSPYKKQDATNYIKVIEDAVKDGTGIDDSCNLCTTVIKCPAEQPYIEVAYSVLWSAASRLSRAPDL